MVARRRAPGPRDREASRPRGQALGSVSPSWEVGAGSDSAPAHGCWGACPLRVGPLCPLCSLPAQAKLGDEVLDYRDLAALPRDKAIYNIDRPDMISYSPYISRMATDRQSYGEVGPAANSGGLRGGG